jgi:RNA polymerase sigma-70 factor, ECF subfamily
MILQASVGAEPVPPARVAPAPAARFEALALREFDFVWRTLRRLGVPASAVPDAAQQVWMVTARKLDDVTVDRERAFLYGTAARIASNARRAGARHARVFDDVEGDAADPAPQPDILLDEHRARSLLDEVIAALSDDVRDVFVLYECEELSSPQIAAMLDLPVGTVASRLGRARSEFQAIAKRLRARGEQGGAR